MTTAPVTSNQESSHSLVTLGLTPIRLRALYPPAHVEADLFLLSNSDKEPRLYANAGLSPSANDLDRLRRRGISSLYLRHQDAKAFRQQLRELASSQVDMAPEARFEVAREAVREDFANAWNDKSPKSFITAAATFSQKVVDICAESPEMTSVLASLALHDGDTFAHISNVATYTVVLARKLGITGENDLRAIAHAGLLHDLGKRWICQDILKKPGKLTPSEREIMSDHPRLGFVELCHNPDFSADQLLMVYQHHERIDGTGYPARLMGDEICWTAKLCSVVDVFDALTARRSYRQPAGHEQALEIIRQGIGTQFCPELVRCWTELAGNVELNLAV